MLNASENPAFPAERPNLGITAKSIHAPDAILNAKSARFRLQRAAAGLLFDPDRAPTDQPHRVTGCQRNRKETGVTVFRAVDGSNARFAGLVTCGSVWHCPVCAAKIAEARRAELMAGLLAWKGQGGAAFLMTLTHPHYADESAADQLAAQDKARQRFKNSRAYKRVMAQYGRIGNVSSLEVTYGQNGWHPHVHELIFCKPGLDADRDAVADLRAAWLAALQKSGLYRYDKIGDMQEHAFDLRGGDFAAEYIAKYGRHPERWTEADELTKAHAKIGKRGNFGAGHVTPFQLLEWYVAGDKRAGALFVEYAEAFAGKRMLTWSPKLKATLKIADLDDEELAIEKDPMPDEAICCTLTAEQWALVLSRDARGEVLFIAAKNGAAGVECLLYELQHHRPRTHRGDSAGDLSPLRLGAGWNLVKPEALA